MELFGYHIVLTTHNSRTSSRMMKYKVDKGPARLLTLAEEIILTDIFRQLIQDNNYRCVAYNTCRDHIHMLLVCPHHDLTKIVQKLKSISSKFFHRHPDISPTMTSMHNNSLWSQKFFRAQLDEWTLAKIKSDHYGEIYTSSYLHRAILYIANNRRKHGLPDSNELQEIINSFVISVNEAYMN